MNLKVTSTLSEMSLSATRNTRTSWEIRLLFIVSVVKHSWTKAKLVDEASGRKGPSRIYEEVSEAIDGMLDCEVSSDLPRDSKQVKQNARQRKQNLPT